jgi:hypothetical protein
MDVLGRQSEMIVLLAAVAGPRSQSPYCNTK